MIKMRFHKEFFAEEENKSWNYLPTLNLSLHTEFEILRVCKSEYTETHSFMLKQL